MIKQLSGIVLALSVAGLAGCGMMPHSTQGAPTAPLTVAQVGQQGATVTLDFGMGLSTQATHRWVKDDIVHYNVILKDMTVGSPNNGVVLEHELGKDKNGIRFAGLSFGKVYRAYVQIIGNKDADKSKALTVLNGLSQETEGVGHVVYDFSELQDINDDQSQSLTLAFDAVSFDGKGALNITGPAPGEYVNVSGGPRVVPE